MKKILGVFKTAPTSALELEALLPLPEIRLNRTLRSYALRIYRLDLKHPIRKLVLENENLDDNAFLDDIPIAEIDGNFPTQLERIRASIKDLVLGREIEEISPALHQT